MEFIIGIIVLIVILNFFKSSGKTKKKQESHDVTFRVEVSDSRGYSRDYDHLKKPKGRTAKWYGLGQPVTVKGYEITDGLVYVGDNLPDDQSYKDDACLINPGLPVKPAEPWEAGDEMGYWTRYESMPPNAGAHT